MNKENKYLGSVKNVKLHPIKKPIEELATIGLRLKADQLKQLSSMLNKQ